MIGQTLGNYEITEKIGAGGMGEVYRARDTKLGRDVAIKSLPDVFASQADRLSRFEREAKVLAGLNHANIGAIYGIEESGGARYLILEMIEGEDLAERLSRGPVPVDQALEIALQIAEALEAAHEQGVVHRDLKPANIKLTPDGRVKVLDFGLAKALDASSADSDIDLSRSPTILGSSPTVAGVILGTAGYMSPEQARGMQVDKRADIFAYGIVLFEMLTGERVFAGKTVSDTLAAVLREDPDFDKLPSDTPAALRRLLERCLEKEARRRLRDIGEARITLETLRSGDADEPGTTDLPARRGFLVKYGGWIVAAAVAASSVVAMTVFKPSADDGGGRLMKASMVMSHDDPSRRHNFGPMVSPDGRYVVFISQDKLWLRDLTTLAPQPLAGTEGAVQPFWSPDGEWIGFGREHELYKVPRVGGQPMLIAALPAGITLGTAASAAWGGDDRIVIGPATAGLHQVPAQGGEVTLLLDPGEGETDFHEVWGLPDGKGWVFVVHNKKGIGKIALLTPDGQRTDLIEIDDSVADVTYSPTGHLLFRRSGGSAGVWALPFSLDRLEATGAPFIAAVGGLKPSVADDGTLVYARGVSVLEAQLVWVSRDGTIGGKIGPPGSTGRPFPQLSPDERYVVMASDFGDGRELFLYDVETGDRRRLTFNDVREDVAVWHPNGQGLLVYESGSFSIDWMSLDGSSPNRKLVEGAIMGVLTPDASQMIFSRQVEGAWAWDIHRIAFDGSQGESTEYVVTGGVDWWPTFSPDGRYIAYMSDETGQNEVYVTPFPNATTRWQVSTNGGEWPAWRAGEIFYTTRDAIYAATANTSGGLTLGTPRKLFERPAIDWSSNWSDGFDVTRDGQRFVIAQPVRDENAAAPEIVVVRNWFAEFDKGATE